MWSSWMRYGVCLQYGDLQLLAPRRRSQQEGVEVHPNRLGMRATPSDRVGPRIAQRYLWAVRFIELTHPFIPTTENHSIFSVVLYRKVFLPEGESMTTHPESEKFVYFPPIGSGSGQITMNSDAQRGTLSASDLVAFANANHIPLDRIQFLPGLVVVVAVPSEP